MKKLAPWLIITWSLLFSLGVLTVLLGSFTSIPDTPMWIIGTLFWVADIIWIIIGLTQSGGKKKTAAKSVFVGNQQVFQRICKETEEAVARYTDAVNRKGILKKSALYERPWFLLCGTSKSGKSSLLKGSGLNFPLKYPSEKDGMIVEGANQVMWYFANEAVWIDSPGSYMDESGKDEWQALVGALKRARPINPVDGVALVVNTNEVLNSDDMGIKELARRLRSRIDDLIAQWGIEFPVYLLFNRTDEVPGFKEYFAEMLDKSQDQIFGATLPVKLQSVMPRLAFAEEFNILCKSLTDFRLDRLFKERNEPKKRMICRFVIHFEGIQKKLGALVAELFKTSRYEGKPLFRGFYFTSCYEKLSSSEQASQEIPTNSDLSMTIANHPLNPNRAYAADSKPKVPPLVSGSKKEVRSAFVLPLFREIMVKDKALVKNTQKRSRQELIRHYSLIGLMAGIIFTVCGFLISAQRANSAFLKQIHVALKTAPADDAPLLEQYKTLEIIHQTLVKLQRYKDKGTPLNMGFGFYKGNEILAVLKESYFSKIKRFLVTPAVKFLEYDIKERSQAFGELAGDDYDNLYRSLKAYLSISEAAARDKNNIDTTFLRIALLDAIQRSILKTVNAPRLPAKVELILQENMGLYLSYLARGEFPKIQENQRLVADARKKLSRLPSAQSLYEAVIGKLSPDVPHLTLDQLLRREGEGILKSTNTISMLYTQRGFDEYIVDAIGSAASNPFKIDWVIGLTKDEYRNSNVDNKKLYEDMIVAYLNDFKSQWLKFLGSVDIEPFGDLQRSSRIIQKLVGNESEIVTLLNAVADSAVLKYESQAEKAGADALEAAGKLKALKKVVKAVDALENRFSISQLSQRSNNRFDAHNAFFNQLKKFANSQGGALDGFNAYKDKAMSLVSGITEIESQGDLKAPEIFNGREKDPLLGGWKQTEKLLTSMADELSASIRKILMRPYEYTGTAASEVLTKTLNTLWQNQILKPFTSRFTGRYPFSIRGDDASYADVMDFFRPNTGTYWGFHDRVLSSYLVKTPNGWTVKLLGSLKLNFNNEIFKSLATVERVRDIFFKPDGTLRVLEINITPSGSNKNKAYIEVGGQSLELIPGGKSAKLMWPVENAASAAIKIQIGTDFSQDLQFNGAWGFMRLLAAAKINKIN
ncbi:MAG: type VI secretion system membrane subunit TssM, partial [Fibrobacter sp.]|nr:type VI secretion system membrane subunit TssM [Fibrobacter sp.]